MSEQMRRKYSHLSIWSLVILLTVGCLLLLYLSRSRTPAAPAGQELKGMTAFAGGPFEASGVADVPGTDGVLFVDNGKPGQVFWMRLDQNGKQVGPIKTVELGVSIEDIEGITTDGTHFYAVSSQSRPKAIAKEGLVRFKFDAATQKAGEVESVVGLKNFLVSNVADLRKEGDRKSKEGGINIEGLAWDPRRSSLLVALRSPIIDGHALLVPLKLRDPRGAFSIDNLEVADSKAIRLPLGGVGIRGIEYDWRKNVFRILSGAAENQDQVDFGLWEWNGVEKDHVLRETTRFEGRLKPEGVARATTGSRDFLIIVFDAGGYTVME